jgi:hypothetical protein
MALMAAASSVCVGHAFTDFTHSFARPYSAMPASPNSATMLPTATIAPLPRSAIPGGKFGDQDERHLDVGSERYVDLGLRCSSRLGSTQIGGQGFRSAATAADTCHDSITARSVGVGRSLVPAVKTVSCLFVNEAEPGDSAFFNNPAESADCAVAGRPEG